MQILCLLNSIARPLDNGQFDQDQLANSMVYNFLIYNYKDDN